MITLTTIQVLCTIYGALITGSLITYLIVAWYYEIGPFLRIPEGSNFDPPEQPARRY